MILSLVVIVHFVDIGGIVDLHFLNFFLWNELVLLDYYFLIW